MPNIQLNNNIYQIQLDLLDIKFFWRALILGTEMEDYPNYNLNVNAISISWYLESSLIKLGLMVVENPQILHIIIIVWKKAREGRW